MTLQNKSNYTHATQQSHSLFCHFLHFDPTSYIHPLAHLLQEQGKDVITGTFALLPQQNRISVSRTTLRRVVYTHRETRRLMPSGLTEKQAQRTAITSRCSFCPRSHCAWCRGNSGKSRGFFSFDYILAKPGYVFFIVALSVIVWGSHYFPSNYIHSIPCGKDIERLNVQIAWGLAFNSIKI